MKHVREDMPDVQTRRPEVSAALASVLDRMTDKDLRKPLPGRADAAWPTSRRRWRSRPRARAGRPARRPPCCARCPSARAAGCRCACAARCRSGAIVALLGRRRRGRASCCSRRASTAPSAAPARAPSSRRAGDPRRLGQRTRRARTTTRSATTRSTTARRRSSSTATPAPTGAPRATAAARPRDKDGVGIYVDAKPGVEARSMEIRHARARLEGRDLRRRRRQPRRRSIARLGEGRRRHRRSEAPALPPRHGDRYRYYLVWITGLAAGRRARRDRRDRAVRAAKQ